jgi:hypothetical protein
MDPRRIPISLPDDGPMGPKHVAGNKYSVVKYYLIINHYVVVMANLTKHDQASIRSRQNWSKPEVNP